MGAIPAEHLSHGLLSTPTGRLIPTAAASLTFPRRFLIRVNVREAKLDERTQQ
jgi:hypothetical protein